MKTSEFLKQLLDAKNVTEAESIFSKYEQEFESELNWVPVGNKQNNIGPINASADAGRSLVERITNGIDAVLELEYDKHNGLPECKSPKEAASAWLNIPSNGGLSKLSSAQRRDLAQKVQIKVREGDGKESRIVEIRDNGTGITPQKMPDTILSLNESNKLQKYYVAGVYGQGGSSTFSLSKYTLIASRYKNDSIVGFTLVKYLDLPPESFKTGHYVYLTQNNAILQTEVDTNTFKTGTLVKHFGYDISSYSSAFGPSSVYGLLNYILFDPILPVFLENEVYNQRRTIKGSRNALNGAVDEDDGEEGQERELAHHMDMFYVNLGDWGQIGIEYWVLKAKPTKKYTQPTAAFVNPMKPIILTQNGQNHAEMSRIIVKKESDLPYIASRLIAHIDCNTLSPTGKRALFVSNREDVKHGAVYEAIQQEIIKALKSDDTLTKLNTEARVSARNEEDESTIQETRNEVAKILKVYGFDITEAALGSSSAEEGKEEEQIIKDHKHPPKPVREIEIHEPPTYIKILWGEDKPITLYKGQRRYIRVETDANSTYHDATDATKSKINIIVTGAKFCGSTPLVGGKLRLVIEAEADSKVGNSGKISIELMRTGLAILTDQRSISIVTEPPSEPSNKKLTIPKFRLEPISQEDAMWNTLGWPEDVSTVASETVEDNNQLVIYYSTVFPKYASAFDKFEKKDAVIGESFKKKYEIWLAVHALLIWHDKNIKKDIKSSEETDAKEDEEIPQERMERCRIATMSALFASREVEEEKATIDD